MIRKIINNIRYYFENYHFNKKAPCIVQFRNGMYGIRRVDYNSKNYLYAYNLLSDLSSNSVITYSFQIKEYDKATVTGNIQAAILQYYTINDKGKIITNIK
jgi:hypothetical protein